MQKARASPDTILYVENSRYDIGLRKLPYVYSIQLHVPVPVGVASSLSLIHYSCMPRVELQFLHTAVQQGYSRDDRSRTGEIADTAVLKVVGTALR